MTSDFELMVGGTPRGGAEGGGAEVGLGLIDGHKLAKELVALQVDTHPILLTYLTTN